MRTYAREVAFCWIYKEIFNGEWKEIEFKMFDESLLTDEDKVFATQLYKGCMRDIDKYRESVANLSTGFTIDRVFKIDYALLVLGMYELDGGQTPIPVVVNEIVSLSKKYSTPKSVSFVNGVLSSYIKK